MALKYAFLSTQENFSALVQTEIKLTNKKKLFYKRTANFTIIITIVRHLSEKIIINKDLTSRMSLKKKKFVIIIMIIIIIIIIIIRHGHLLSSDGKTRRCVETYALLG